MQLRGYQLDIIERGTDVLLSHSILYLAMEVRTGKTLTSLNIAEKAGATSVLFVTKKKAMSSIEKELIEKAYQQGALDGYEPNYGNGEQYYNETFGNK